MVMLMILVFCALHSINGKYVLIDVKDDEGTNGVMPMFRRKQGVEASRIAKKRWVYGKYAHEGDFPIKIPLTPSEKEKCKNKDLQKEGTFYVKKESVQKRFIDYQFTALTKPNDREQLTELGGQSGGICDLVETADENNQGCGLAKYLMATCFQDNSILGDNEKGLDISEESDWADEPETRKEAIRYCKTITYLRCAPFGDPKPPQRVCISYIRAGSLANFDILFTYKESFLNTHSKKKNFNVFKLGESLETTFSNDADDFIDDYGYTWYFCKCKEDMKQKCMGMADNNP